MSKRNWGRESSVKRLPRLLDGLEKQGVDIVQSFAEEVVLIRYGQPVSLKPSHVARRI
jgi:hypothetical protein